MNKKINWTILLILILAFWLRIWKINEVPHGFNADEAAIGYNNYSLIQTGKDEHGNPWPINFQSFNDYKPGGYFYLDLPFVLLFGLNELSVRLPSIILGVVSIYLIYLFTKELFNEQKKFLIYNWQIGIGELAALILSISPWHIHFSRGAWETNVATAFMILGSWLYLRASRFSNFTQLILSLLAFIFSAYCYHSARIVAPLLLITLIIINFKKFIYFRKNILLFFFIGVLISLPLILSLLKGEAISRFTGVGIMGDIGPFWSTNRLRGEHQLQTYSLIIRLLHNRPTAYLVKVYQNWLSHFNGDFLFIDGDRIGRNHNPGIGQLYYLDFGLLVLSFYFFFKNQEKKLIFPFTWLLIAPFPAALTLQSPHALRSHSMVVPLSVLMAYGLYQLFTKLSQKKVFLIIVILFLIISYLWQVGYFLDQYFLFYPNKAPEVWEEGMKQLVDYLKPIQKQYTKIYVTDQYDQPYILFLFYLRYPPKYFQQEGKLIPRDKFGFSTVRDFANFHFEQINWQKLKNERDVLVIGTDDEIPDTANIIKRIYFRNKKTAFKIANL